MQRLSLLQKGKLQGNTGVLPGVEYDLQQEQNKICQLSGSVCEAGIL